MNDTEVAGYYAQALKDVWHSMLGKKVYSEVKKDVLTFKYPLSKERYIPLQKILQNLGYKTRLIFTFGDEHYHLLVWYDKSTL